MGWFWTGSGLDSSRLGGLRQGLCCMRTARVRFQVRSRLGVCSEPSAAVNTGEDGSVLLATVRPEPPCTPQLSWVPLDPDPGSVGTTEPSVLGQEQEVHPPCSQVLY